MRVTLSDYLRQSFSQSCQILDQALSWPSGLCLNLFAIQLSEIIMSELQELTELNSTLSGELMLTLIRDRVGIQLSGHISDSARQDFVACFNACAEGECELIERCVP